MTLIRRPTGDVAVNEPKRYLIAEVRECESQYPCPDYFHGPSSCWPWVCYGCNGDGTRTVATDVEIERTSIVDPYGAWPEFGDDDPDDPSGLWREVDAS